MNSEELKNRYIYAAPITSNRYAVEDTEVNDVVTRYKRERPLVSGGASEIAIRNLICYASDLQYSVLRTLEDVCNPGRNDRSSLWGDWIMEHSYWQYSALYIVVRDHYAKLDVVLSAQGCIVGVTEEGEARKALGASAERSHWPFVRGSEIPILAAFQVDANFLRWQTQTIENIWNSPTRYCHLCGAPTLTMRCNHTQNVISAIRGERKFEYVEKIP